MSRFCPIEVILLLLLFTSCFIEPSFSAVTVTAPTNGVCLDVAPGTFTTLSSILITEEARSDLPTQTNTTLILTIPAGFEFNPGVGTVTGQTPVASGNITALAIDVTSSAITITITVSGTNKWDEITISGIQVRATTYGVSGNILRLAGAAGGTASVAGNDAGAGVDHGYLESEKASGIISISNGNWTNPSIWSGGFVPTCIDSVFIHHNVVVNNPVSVRTLVIESTGILQANFSTTISNAFHINGNGTYIHNFSANAPNSIFNGTEYFAPTSNIIITAWYNIAVPFPTSVSSNFGNITFNTGTTWGQKGMFAPSKIKGTTTVSSGTITMDEGAGMTTNLELGDVVINNSGALIMASGTARNLTLVTGNYIDTSSSSTSSVMILNCTGNLNWTANGNVFISHNWRGYQHSGSNPGNTSITINGDLTIAGGQFTINNAVAAPLTLYVAGTTTITGSPTYVRFVDSNNGDLNFTTTNFYIAGGNNSTLMGGNNSLGNSLIHVTNDLVVSGTGTSATLYNSLASSGTLQLTTGRDLIVTDGELILANTNGFIQTTASRNIVVNSSSGMLRGQINSNCTAGTIVNVAGILETNSGTIRVSEGLGDIELNIVEDMNINNGTFHGIYNMVAVNNGSALLNCDNINFDGGTFSFFTSSISDGKIIALNCSNNVNVNFLNNTDIFAFVALAGSNNALLNLNIDYDLHITGNFPGSYFLSSASSGIESVYIGGSMIVENGDVYFVGNEGSLANTHAITTTINGDVIISGGTTSMSTGAGTATVNIGKDVLISGGILNLKYDTGVATMTINGNYIQTGGIFNIHSRAATTPNSCEVIVNKNFSMDNGILNFDNHAASSSLAEHHIQIIGTSYSLSGNAIITHANNLTTNFIFGRINFRTNGTISYSRNSSTNQIRHVKYLIGTATTVDASTSTHGFQMTSVQSSNAVNHNSLDIYGILNMGDRVLSARQNGSYYSRLTVRNNGRYRTSHTGGLYSGSNTVASSINGYVTSFNRVGYTLEPNSTVEYYGTGTSVITGIPNGYANTNNQKYGNLEINFTGSSGSTWVYPETSGEVFIRTSLILTEGEFNLDEDHSTNGGGRIITLENGATISRTNGFIRSETEDGSGRVIWTISSNGSYVIPFGYDASTYIPFTFQQTSGSSGSVEIGTYRSNADNTPYPPTVTHVRDTYGTDNSAQTVDRFWNIIVPGNSTATLTYSYANSEAAGIIAPRAQQWEPVSQGWFPPAGIQSNPTGTTTTASGISSYNSWWTLSAASSPLPVELLYFDVKQQADKVKLLWETASETNSDYFEIQKSYNGLEFETFGSVKASGFSTSNSKYEYWDKISSLAYVYYRLKQFDFDGTFNYSPVKTIKFDKKETFSVYPTLVSSQSVIQISLPDDGFYTIQIIDLTSREVFKHSLQSTSNSKINIDLYNHNISEGIYLVTATGPSGFFNQKVVVQ